MASSLLGLSVVPPLSLIVATSILAGLISHGSVSAAPFESGLKREAEQLARQWEADAVRRSRELYLQAADHLRDRGDNRSSVECLLGAARQSVILGNKKEALAFLKNAVETAIRFREQDLVAIVSSELAIVTFDIGLIKESESYLAQALGRAEVSNSEESKASAYYAAGEINYFRNDSQKAEDYYTRALEIHERTGVKIETVRTLVSLGWVHFRHLKFDRATEVFERANSIAAGIGDRKGEAMALKGIGTIHNAINNKQSALKYYFAALDLFPLSLDLSEKASVHNGVASVFEYFGNYEGAIASRETALELFDRDDYVVGQYATLPSLGEHYLAVGDIAKADAAFERARQMAASGGDSFYSGIALQGTAKLYEQKRDHAAAISALNKSLEYLNTVGSRRERSISHLNLGRIYLERNRPDDARSQFAMAKELNEVVQDKFFSAELLYQSGRVELAVGNREEAARMFATSVALTESLSRSSANAQLRRSLISTEYERYHAYIELLMGSGETISPDDSLLALSTLERGRAQALLETLALAGATIAADADPVMVKKEEALRNSFGHASDKLVDRMAADASKEEIELLKSEVNILLSELEEIRAELKQTSPLYSSIKDPSNFDLVDFQANTLDEESILLEYFLGTNQSYLWMVGKHEFQAYELPSRAVIEPKIDELTKILRARTPIPGEPYQDMRDRLAAADSRYTEIAHELSNLILGPVAEKIQGKRLIIVPDGKMHTLSINALPLPNSQSSDPILLTHEVAYQPSARTMSMLTKLRREDLPRPRGALIFSDPVFNRDDGRLVRTESTQPQTVSSNLTLRFAESLSNLRRLPASGAEAESIAAIIGSSSADLFSGFRARRDHLLGSPLSDYKIIHLATHGLVNQERPELSAVVLSRFDENGQPLNESVRLQDIYSMKLNADLVVLSACQTAAGKEIKGEGVMGLNNAFLQAGARSVVASLWQVEDNATNLLMKEFYRGMADGLSTSAALRQAQIALYRDPQFRSPFFWAAFTLQGDMNRRPEIGQAFPRWWLGGVPLIFLLAVVVWQRFRRQAGRAL